MQGAENPRQRASAFSLEAALEVELVGTIASEPKGEIALSNDYQVECDCSSIKVTLSEGPIVRGFCHCSDCRDLLKIPYHSVTAWEKRQVKVDDGSDKLIEFQHLTKRMKRFFCRNCGETLFNSNAKDWRVVSQLLIRKCYGGELPEPLRPKSHFFYASRIGDIDDELPKRD